MGCDMCGKDAKLFLTQVEEVEMQLCEGCKVYGQVKRAIPTAKELKIASKAGNKPGSRHSQHSVKSVEVLIASFGKKIQKARLQRNLTQDELAKMLAMKVSQLHTFESGHHEPDIATAKQLESALNIKLLEVQVEEQSDARDPRGAEPSGPLTIADIMKQAMKK